MSVITDEPNPRQSQIIWQNKLNPRNWIVQEETETKLIVIYRYGKTEKELDKNVNLWKE